MKGTKMETLTNKLVITRKPHTCWGCAIQYPKGTKMQYLTQAEGGTILTSYWCKTCRTYWNEYMGEVDGFPCGELRNNDVDKWEALRKES